MDLKGQMIQLTAVDGILFLGTPSVEKLDELIAKGLYISDLPIHDATRDVILVGEQTKAQVRGNLFVYVCIGTYEERKTRQGM